MSTYGEPTWTVPYAVRAVTTADAKAAATPDVTEELGRLCTHVLASPDRKQRTRTFLELRENASEPTKNFLKVTRLRELQHKNFMEYVLTNFVEEFTAEVRSSRKLHDWSKDELFFFAAPAFYDGKVNTPEMEQFKDDELQRHYRCEAHHPEHENTGDECSELDILEMAIDRLARNVQWGNGLVDMEVMMKYLPTFPTGDKAGKRAIFQKYLEKYRGVVQTQFCVMFPDAAQWSKI